MQTNPEHHDFRVTCHWRDTKTKTHGAETVRFESCRLVGTPPKFIFDETTWGYSCKDEALRNAIRLGRLALFMDLASVSMVGGHRRTALHDRRGVGWTNDLLIPRHDHTISWRVRGTRGLAGTFVTTEPYGEVADMEQIRQWCDARPATLQVWERQGFWNPPWTWLALVMPSGFAWAEQVARGLDQAMRFQVSTEAGEIQAAG